jgi:hypothetical protein
MPNHSKLDHRKLAEILVKNGFYQIIEHRTAGWFHKCGIIAYYTTYKGGVCYMVRYKLDEFEARNTTELNHILTNFKNRGIL